MTVPEATPFWRRLIRLITFIDLPIRKKFFLFWGGTSFWFLVMATVTLLSLTRLHATYQNMVFEAVPQERALQSLLGILTACESEMTELDIHADPSQLARRLSAIHNRLQSASDVLEIPTSAMQAQREVPLLGSAGIQKGRTWKEFQTEMNRRLGMAEDSLHVFLERYQDRTASTQLNQDFDATVEIGNLRQILADALRLARSHGEMSQYSYLNQVQNMQSIMNFAYLLLPAVLGVALILLTLFTWWISRAIGTPVNAIVRQIHSLGTGEVDLTQKITVVSDDEIGLLSREFNALMDTVHSMNMFKRVIEEDVCLEDVYARLGEVFQVQLGIEKFRILELCKPQKGMQQVYPPVTEETVNPCDPEVLTHCEWCRARRTGRSVSSLDFPGVCIYFRMAETYHHVCIPLLIGGQSGGLIQFLLPHGPSLEEDQIVYRTTLFQAEAYIRQSLSVLEAKRLLQTLRESALKDALTSLYNRRFLQDHAGHLTAGVLRRKGTLGLVMCDLDFFKQVNDQYGHDIGDMVLRETAQRIQECVRESDVVIRFGGEEFLVLLLDIQPGESTIVAEKIRQSVAEHKIVTPAGMLQKTISLGVCEYPGDTESLWQAIKFADVALYRAKDGGRNQVQRFEREMWKEERF